MHRQRDQRQEAEKETKGRKQIINFLANASQDVKPVHIQSITFVNYT